MELEQNLTHLNCYDTIMDTSFLREETMELIVPDSSPDILRVVDTCCTLYLERKEAAEGRTTLSGTAKATVLYEPDGEEGMCRLELNIPWNCAADQADITPKCKLIASPRPLSAETRLLNPRKVLVRIEFVMALRIFAPQTASICTGVVYDGETGVQQRKASHRAYFATTIQEKPFHFSDELAISGSKPALKRLLRSRAEVVPGDAKIIGTKLIIKGEVHLHLLYSSRDDALCTARFELPYSQIMEAPGVEEDAVPALEVLITELSCQPEHDEEGRQIAVSMDLLAQAVVREERTVEMLADLYSTMYEIRFDRTPYTFYSVSDNGVSRQSLRELVESVEGIGTVVDAYVTVGHTKKGREGKESVLSAEARVSLLCITEDGRTCCIKRTIPAAHRLQTGEGSTVLFDCIPGGECAATPSAGGVEVRLALDFQYCIMAAHQVASLSELVLDETAPRDTAGKPSVVLRTVEEGEGLWEIARDYATTMEDIMLANGMEEEEP
ncbi:MAG: DUF3794 domain-containing protein, partial [Clostridiales bacterium]|nr:DUF3794 domain-containing protein [Clostridiales bacterium]